MVGWHRHLQLVFRQVGKRVEHNLNPSANFSCHYLRTSLPPGELPYIQSQQSQPSRNISQYLQQLQFSNTRKLLADSSDAAPIPSPLTPILAIESGNTEDQKVIFKPSKVQAVLKGIKQSPKKVNLVAELVRGMFVEDALLQLQVAIKRAAKTCIS